MPAVSKFREKIAQEMGDKALALYKEGLSLREVAKALEKMGFKRSHEWVNKEIQKRLSPEVDKTDWQRLTMGIEYK